MPRIPTVDKFTPGRQSVGVRVNQNLGADQYQALQRVGGATREVSKFLFDYGMKLQDHINKGDLADAEVAFDETQQRVSDVIAQEPDQNKWEGITKKIWEDHKKVVDKKNYAPVVRNQVDNSFKIFEGKSLTGVKGQKVKRDIQTANANLIRLATKQRKNGDIEGAVETLNGLNMSDPVAKENMIQRTLSEGAYQDVFQQIQVNYHDEEALDGILEGLQSKGDDGYGTRADGTTKGTGFFGPLEMRDGSGMVATEISIGVEIDGREVEIPTLVPTLTNEQKDFLLSGGDPRGREDIVNASISHAEKRIEEGLSPFANDGDDGYTNHEGLGYDARKTLENQILARKRAIKRTQTVTANKLARDVARGDASLEDINSADIPEGEKEVLRTQVDFSAKIEQETSGAYEIISNRMKAHWSQGLLGMERQPDEDEYASILKDISTVKLTKESKRKLFDMYLELKANDLSDNQEEGTGWLWDRDVSQPEVDLRTEMGEIYKESFNTLGVDAISGAMWDQEKQIRDYFDRNPEATEEDIRVFKEMLTLQITDDVATKTIGASINEDDL